MPKRKLSQGQSDPSTIDPLGFEMEVDSEVYVDNSHSAPTNVMKPECIEIMTTFEEEEVMLLTSGSGSHTHLSQSENDAEFVTPDAETHVGGQCSTAEDESDIEIREDVYVISEITPDKFLVSHTSETEPLGELEENSNNEELETITEMTETIGHGDFVPVPVHSSELVSDSDVQLVDFGLYCANCGIQFDESECPKISELILTDSETIVEENQLEYGIVVSVADALSFIFELKLNEEEQGERPLVDAGIGLCNKCGNILAQMYKLHRDFYEVATTNSYLDLLFAKMFSRENQSSKNQSTEKKSHGQQKCLATVQDDGNQMTEETPNLCSSTLTEASSQNSENTQDSVSPTRHPNPSTIQNQPQTENAQPNSTNNGVQPNYLVICPLVIAANAGTNTLATMRPQEVKNEEDAFFGTVGATRTKKYRRNRPKYTSTCGICGKVFHSYLKNTLETHINIVHRNESPHKCKICGRPCSTHKNMEAHMLTHLGKEERGNTVPVKPTSCSKQYLCSECGTTLKSASSLRLHLSKHTNPKPYLCDKCDRRFGDKVSLKRHQVIHEEDGFFQFQCDGCGQAFKVASLLKEHNMYCVAKSAERPHRCNLCGKRFKLKQHLELHLYEMHKFTKEGAREAVYPGVPRKKRAK